MLKRKTQHLELEGTTYMVKEPTGSQLQEILECQDKGKRIEAAYTCLRYCLFGMDNSPIFAQSITSEQLMNDDISPSVATTVTQVAMGMVPPKKL